MRSRTGSGMMRSMCGIWGCEREKGRPGFILFSFWGGLSGAQPSSLRGLSPRWILSTFGAAEAASFQNKVEDGS